MKVPRSFGDYLLKHKTVAFLLFFILWITVLDDNSLYKRYCVHKDIAELKDELRKYQEQYKQTAQSLRSMETSKEEVEKIARKQYYMKKEDEDIYIVQSPSDDYTNKDIGIYNEETEQN